MAERTESPTSNVSVKEGEKLPLQKQEKAMETLDEIDGPNKQ